MIKKKQKTHEITLYPELKIGDINCGFHTLFNETFDSNSNRDKLFHIISVKRIKE